MGRSTSRYQPEPGAPPDRESVIPQVEATCAPDGSTPVPAKNAPLTFLNCSCACPEPVLANTISFVGLSMNEHCSNKGGGI